MADDKNKKGSNQLEEDEDNKPNETILEKEERDPDEAVFAEQAIHHYAETVLAQFRDQAEMAMSQLESFITSQNDKEAFNERNFLDGMGQVFLDQVMNLFGGRDSPIAQAIFPMVDGGIDFSVRESQAQPFCHDMAALLRDVTWYVRDNLQMVLSNQWDELRDLAYEGATDFIPALHAYGLPEIDFDSRALSQPMMDMAQAHLDLRPKMKEEKVEQDQMAQFEEEEKKVEEQQQINPALEEEKKEEVAI
jgi:hypothetical protein